MKRKLMCVMGKRNKYIIDNKEVVGCPHERLLSFSDWLRDNLVNGCMSHDIDFVIWNNNKKTIMLLEAKTYKIKYPDSAEPTEKQRILLRLLLKLFNQISKIITGWKFKGVHLIQFDMYDFETGNVYLDKKLISEPELKTFLNS